MRNFGFLLAAAAATTLTFVAAPAAFAADGTVTWKGLDLTTDAGRTELDSRITKAANAICVSGPVTGSRLNRNPSASCLAEARTEIRAQLAKRLPATAFVESGNALASAGNTNSDAR